jgi:pre-mRNA-splicing factor RBM22/SLT11
MPEEKGDLSQQNIKDRYYGINDPVAKKIMGKVGESPTAPPADTTIKTLYVGNVDAKIKEADLR